MQFGPQIIFERLDLKLYTAEKVGLVGPNGCGKTTLLKLILGMLPPDAGQVHQKRGLKIAYLLQEPVFSGDKTVIQELHDSAREILELQNRMHDSAQALAGLLGDRLKIAIIPVSP